METAALTKKYAVLALAFLLVLSTPFGAIAQYATLQKGSSGDAVLALEQALASKGFFDAWPDSTYDDATVYAVKIFQEENGLTADGIAGDRTQVLLFGAESSANAGTVPSTVSAPSKLRELGPNKSGTDVESLQKRLTELGYYSGRISGNYGTLTQKAVKAFQSANGLSADGLAGVKTQTKMYADTAVAASGAPTGTTTGNTASTGNTTSTTYSTLSTGSKGDAVLSMQTKLKELGYYSGSLTGNYGTLTWTAVRNFQKKNGLTADGIAGSKTLEKLYATSSSQTDTGTAGNTAGTPVTDTVTGTYKTLQTGSKGDAVLSMQTKLKELGYYSGSLTGNYGTLTWTAVRNFQKKNGLTADGIAGSKTLETLYGTSASSGTVTDTVPVTGSLKLGSSGAAVTSLQKRLIALGYLSGSADGMFGTSTQKALMAFQSANGLTADGYAGSQTLTKLNSSSAVSAGSGSSSGNSSGTSNNDTSQTLSHGMKNSNAVKDMQTQLTKLGYYTGTITGNFGDLTKTAVISFQKKNGLTADGIAGTKTLVKLYSGTAVALGGSAAANEGSEAASGSRPNAANVLNVNWFSSIRPKYKNGTIMQVYDFENNLTWQCRMMSNGKHSDSEPLTADDTAIMYKAFGNKTTWTPKAVWITMPDGKTYMASLHNTPHLSGSIKTNNFDGHLCIHFPRAMDEAEETGPYAVSHQKAIIKGWEKTQALAGK